MTKSAMTILKTVCIFMAGAMLGTALVIVAMACLWFNLYLFEREISNIEEWCLWIFFPAPKMYELALGRPEGARSIPVFLFLNAVYYGVLAIILTQLFSTLRRLVGFGHLEMQSPKD